MTEKFSRKNVSGYLSEEDFGLVRPQPAKFRPEAERSEENEAPRAAEAPRKAKARRTTVEVSAYVPAEYEKKLDKLAATYFLRYEEKINRQDILRYLIFEADEAVLARIRALKSRRP